MRPTPNLSASEQAALILAIVVCGLLLLGLLAEVA